MQTLQDAFTSGATVKQKNKAVISWALQFIKSTNCTSQPINFEVVTDKKIVNFFQGGKKQHRWKQVSKQKWLWILQIRFQVSIPSVPGFYASSF